MGDIAYIGHFLESDYNSLLFWLYQINKLIGFDIKSLSALSVTLVNFMFK